MKKKILIFLAIIILLGNKVFVFATVEIEKVDFVELEGEVLKEEYETMIGHYSLIPVDIREHFQLAGWKIILIDQELEETYYPEFSHLSICGVFDSGKATIYLENSPNGLKAVIHEVGHYIDNQYGYVRYSNTQEWCEIMDRSQPEGESFADGFSDYMLDPEKLRRESMEVYGYMEEVVSTFN